MIVDAVYSMDGDVCPLPELVALCREFDAWLVVDEAHSLGVLGETGHGILEYFNMSPDDVELLTGSLSKTIPAVGGFVAGKRDVIQFLRHNARAFVFSAALPPAAVAAVTASLEVIEEEPWRIKAVRRNIERFIAGLNALGYDTLQTKSCVIPIVIGKGGAHAGAHPQAPRGRHVRVAHCQSGGAAEHVPSTRQRHRSPHR